MDAKNLLTSPAILTKGNVNMNISAAMNSVENSIKLDNGVLGVKCYKRKFKNEMPTRVEFCKSGKDRTGIVQMENSQIAINNYLCLDRKSDLAKSNYKQLAVSGHTQQLAGMQGGTIGCHSLKVFRGNCISSEQASILGIINQKSAYGNSAIKTLNNTKKVQSFRKEFQTSLEKHELGLDKEREVRKIQKVTKGHNKTLEKFKKHAVENSGKKQAPVALNKETFKENQKNAQMSK
jgi:hypothetical protein